MRRYPQFSFWISIVLVNIYIFCIIINRGKNTFKVVSIFLNENGSVATVLYMPAQTDWAWGDISSKSVSWRMKDNCRKQKQQCVGWKMFARKFGSSERRADTGNVTSMIFIRWWYDSYRLDISWYFTHVKFDTLVPDFWVSPPHRGGTAVSLDSRVWMVWTMWEQYAKYSDGIFFCLKAIVGSLLPDSLSFESLKELGKIDVLSWCVKMVL